MGRIQPLADAHGSGDGIRAEGDGRYRASRANRSRRGGNRRPGGERRIQRRSANCRIDRPAASWREKMVSEMDQNAMDRRTAVRKLLAARDGALVVTGLG